MHKIIRLPKVMEATGLARSTIYRRMEENSFPAQVPIGQQAVGWVEEEIQAWVKERIEQAKQRRQ